MIDYRKWDFSGKGVNILPFLTPKEQVIWNAAFPFQDKRDDHGQGEVVTYFALELLRTIPAQREVVIPAAILHDTGFGRIDNPAKTHRDAVESGILGTPAYRQVHQDKGVEVAKEILLSVGYPVECRQPICDIIADHDTRLKEPTLEGKVMMDADVLWRFTIPHRKAYLCRANSP